MRPSMHLLKALKLRPFPLQLSVGNDIVKVSRIGRLLFDEADDNAGQLKFLRKVFTPAELQRFQARYPDLATCRSDETRMNTISQHVAGRFAAKEAVIKACTWRRLLLRDVEINRSSETNAPYGVILDPETSTEHGSASADANASGQIVQVGISHEDDYATAICIAGLEPRSGDVGGEAAARAP